MEREQKKCCIDLCNAIRKKMWSSLIFNGAFAVKIWGGCFVRWCLVLGLCENVYGDLFDVGSFLIGEFYVGMIF